MITQSPYEYYNQTLCVRAKFLYEETDIVSYSNYKKLVIRNHINIVRPGKGKNSYALVDFNSIERDDIKEKIIAIEPPTNATKSILETFITPDHSAIKYFACYRKPNGEPLSLQQQKTYATNAILLNAVKLLNRQLWDKYYTIGGRKNRIWNIISEAVNDINTVNFNHTLPGNCRRLQGKFEKYIEFGLDSLIDGNIGNENTLKIKGDIADWILSQYCLPKKMSIPVLIKKYDTIRDENNWQSITEQAVTKWLNKPENKRIWMLARHGEEAYTNSFTSKIQRDKSNWFPNVMWAIDGSKLDWIHYAETKNGMAAKLKIDPTVDVYSEKIIGWSFSEAEKILDHFSSIRMALNTSGCRPYMIQYDNQSGHKSKRMQDLYTSLVAKDGGTHFPNKAYSHANPIEQLFGRIQKQVLNQFWFSDKQSVKAKLLDNQVNIDFIQKHKHLLYSREELEKAWEVAVNVWNNTEHPTIKGKTRNEVYNQAMPMKEEVGIVELSTMFWLAESKKITYKPTGLTLTVGGVTTVYEVYDNDNSIDLEFRRKYVGEKFIVRYDPEYLDTYVQLIHEDESGQKRLIANAQPKRSHENVPVLMKEGDKARWFKDYEVQHLELERDRTAYQELMNRTGITPETMIEEQDFLIKFGREMNKEDRNELEAVSIIGRL